MWPGCWGGRSHLSVFSCERNRADAGNIPPTGPLSWRCCPGEMGLGLPLQMVGWGCTSPPLVPLRVFGSQCLGTD